MWLTTQIQQHPNWSLSCLTSIAYLDVTAITIAINISKCLHLISELSLIQTGNKLSHLYISTSPQATFE